MTVMIPPEGLGTSEPSQEEQALVEESSSETDHREAEPGYPIEPEKNSSEETLVHKSRLTRVKMFDDYEAKFRFETDFRMRNYSPAKEINLEFFYREGFRCFEMFKFNGWEFFLNLKEPIYPMLIREFYANLKIIQATMESNILVRGRRVVLSKGLLSEVLKCPNTGICPDLGNDVITESYQKGEFVNELMGRESSLCQIGLLGADDRILFHIIDQVIMPKQNKGNDPNNTALFIMWCLKKTLRVNLPHIIVSHMRHICDSSQELAYGMVITLIAKHMKVDLSEFEGEEASFQSKIDIGKLHQMQYRKVGKTWVKKGYDLPKGSKRKIVGNKGRGKAKRVGPYVRKSARLHKEKEKGSEKLVNLEEEEASSHIEKETLLSEDTVTREPEISIPLSLSVETISQKPLPKIDIPSPKSPTLPELLKDPKNEHSLFHMLQETLRTSTFAHDAMELNNSLLKQILKSIQATNGLLTSIQSLLQK
ncbi:uncharacterized protein G2W53_029279 [Senna tora]|uniref:Putative plant transposon protein domain-containing protein n=1 Tax=Senna tora TaxID=362788 RepID=A0A834T5C6_9FABA|nr:uncharacterized protein G2W53_029279 [Senna tora]